MGDKNERLQMLEQRLDDMALQFESIVKQLGNLNKVVESQGRTINSLRAKLKKGNCL